ncbi:hypothetical protein ACFYRN_43265 [Streptomyces sp. NPDC005227]|uniref:hypothetical protein n=1 Tax=Streptomyces sp. NPDC005227 TaxID=3364707 RepID=UPI003687AA24
MNHQERRQASQGTATAEDAATEQLALTLIYVADAADNSPEMLVAEMNHEVLTRLYRSIFAGINRRGTAFGICN